jgi:hypothetical protein
VTLEVRAAEDVSDFDAARLDGMVATVAADAGVAADRVRVSVEPASVKIIFTILVPPGTAASAVKAAVQSALGTAALASTALGITVATGSVSVTASTDGSGIGGGGGGGGGIGVGVIAGAVCGAVALMALVAGIVWYVQKHRRETPLFEGSFSRGNKLDFRFSKYGADGKELSGGRKWGNTFATSNMVGQLRNVSRFGSAQGGLGKERYSYTEKSATGDPLGWAGKGSRPRAARGQPRHGKPMFGCGPNISSSKDVLHVATSSKKTHEAWEKHIAGDTAKSTKWAEDTPEGKHIHGDSPVHMRSSRGKTPWDRSTAGRSAGAGHADEREDQVPGLKTVGFHGPPSAGEGKHGIHYAAQRSTASDEPSSGSQGLKEFSEHVSRVSVGGTKYTAPKRTFARI